MQLAEGTRTFSALGLNVRGPVAEPTRREALRETVESQPNQAQTRVLFGAGTGIMRARPPVAAVTQLGLASCLS